MKKIKYILGALALVFSLQSCEDLLEQDNPNNVTAESGVQSLSGIEKIARGIYTGLPTDLEVFNNATITDEVVFPAADNQNQGNGRGQYSWEYSPGTVTDRDDIGGLYRGYYSMINRTNIIINNIDKLSVQTAADELAKQVYKAEAYGMRAYGHYHLLRNFSPKYNAGSLGIAYKTENNDNEKPSRLTMAESYAKVLEDLNTAINTFPATVPTGFGGTYGNNRITKAALQGIKAQIALDMGNYDEAISAANAAIGTRTLVTTQAELINLWSDRNDYNEVIFKKSNIQGAGSSLGQSFLYSNNQVQWNVSETLMTKFDPSDYRNSLFVTNVGAFTTSGVISGKYQLPYHNGVKGIIGMGDIKLIRTADMILVLAESYARKGDLTNAFANYKKVRDARNAGASIAFTSQTDALNNILDERARELNYEGTRINDLKRFEKTVSRIAADSRPNYPVLTLDKTFKLTLPIPQAEMFANENMKQNEGW